MAFVGSLSTASRWPPVLRAGPEADPVVVWLRGEHDSSTDEALCLELARAIALNDAPLVLDMSEVELISASTLGVIVRAREFLRAHSRSLTVRSPSARARRVIDACGLGDLVVPGPEEAGDLMGKGLGSWVEVPAAERSDGRDAPLMAAPVPAQLSRARARRAHPASTTGLAAPA